MKNSIKRFIAIAGAVFSLVMVITGIALTVSGEFKESLGAGIFMIALFAVLFIFCARASIKLKKSVKGKKQLALEERNAFLQEHEVLFSGTFKHFYGLPFAEGVLTQCHWCKNKIMFEANGVQLNLDISKISDISHKTDVEIQKQYVSSIGGAAAGAALFGTVGAMIGGRAKKKEIRTTTWYLIFTYIKDDSVENIAFETNGNLPKASLFVNKFKEVKPKTAQSFDL